MKKLFIRFIIKQCSVFLRGYYYWKHVELKNYKQRKLSYCSVKKKSIIVIYKQRNLLYYYVKKSIIEVNLLLFTFHSHHLFLISLNQKRGYIYFLL